MERPAGAGSRGEVMASHWRQGRGEGNRSPWWESNPAADPFVRPLTLLPSTFLPEGSVKNSVPCEIEHQSGWVRPEVEPLVIPDDKRREEAPAVETERPPADHKTKSRVNCAEFDPLGLNVTVTKKRHSQGIHKVPAKLGAKAVVICGRQSLKLMVSRSFMNGSLKSLMLSPSLPYCFQETLLQETAGERKL